MLFGNSENPHQCNAGLDISFSHNVRKELFMPVVINQVLCSTNFVPIKDLIDSSILKLILFGLAQNLVF
jgi:hypothetical protein